MGEFVNSLILKEEPYENGFFPRVPKTGKSGSAFILTGGCEDDIIVTDRTTVKQIRQGRYTQLVEISTRSYMKEIRFSAASKETYFSFDVYVKAVIQVKDPIVFYANRNIDVDAYFHTLFSLDVKKITRQYGILDYEDLDAELTRTLSSYNTIDASTGFSYQISAVNAEPGEKAKAYVEQHDKQKLDAQMKKSARALAKDAYTTNFEEAVLAEIAEGKISEADAAIKIDEYRNKIFDNYVRQGIELRDKDLLTNHEAKVFISSNNSRMNPLMLQDHSKGDTKILSGMDEFYPEGEGE